MIWLALIGGIALGAGGYYLYERFSGTVISRIRKLETRLTALKAKAVADVRKI